MRGWKVDGRDVATAAYVIGDGQTNRAAPLAELELGIDHHQPLAMVDTVRSRHPGNSSESNVILGYD